MTEPLMASTSHFGWPYPVRGANPDPADMPYNLKSLAEAVEATLKSIEDAATAQRNRYNYRPIYFARRVAALSIPNGVATAVPMDMVEVNTILSPRQAGYYLIAGGASFLNVTNEPGERIAGISVNSAMVTWGGGQAPLTGQGVPTMHNTAAIVRQLAANDTVELRVWNSSGAALGLNVAVNYQAYLLMMELSGAWPVVTP